MALRFAGRMYDSEKKRQIDVSCGKMNIAGLPND